MAPGPAQHRGRPRLFGNKQEALRPHRPAQSDLAGDDGHGNGQGQWHPHGRQPQQGAAVDGANARRQQGNHAGHGGQLRHGVAPWNGLRFAGRRLPVQRNARQRHQHKQRMGQHAHGGLQQGQHAFEQGAFQQAPAAAILLLLTPHEDGQHPQHAGQEQHAQRPGPQRQQFGGQDVPVGQHWRARHPQGGAQRHEGQPQRGGQVGHGARHEHGAVHGVDAGLGHQACVLQVALAPAAVALQFGQQVGRLLLVAAHQVGHQPHVVARAAHQRGFHKVVAHDAARQAPFAGDGRERAVLHEGFHADDGVVPPVMRFTQLPELHAQREQAAGDARGELLRTRVQRDVANGLRSRLDDACRRVGFHELGHGDDAVAAHHAVGVQHHHVAVVLAPAAAEVGHIACLAVGAALAQAVVHLHLRLLRVGSQCHAQVFPGGAFCAGNVAVVAVGQHEHVKRLPVAGGRHRFAGGAQPGKHGGHVFVADGHDDGGARVGRQCVARHAAGRERMLVAAQHDPKTHHPGHEAGHHPG